MFIEKLDIVNDCLRSMGETKLNDLEEDHVYKDDALDLLEKVSNEVMSRRMWFNTEWLKLVPQATSKFIMIPTDVISIDTKSQCGMYNVAQRGRRLYDTGRNKYEFDRPITVRISRKLDYDDIPDIVQEFISADTVLRFQDSFDGDNTKYQKILLRRQEALVKLMSEHIRQLKANPLFARASINVLRERYFNFSGHPWHSHTTFPG